MEIVAPTAIIATIALFFFLGWVQSHWIAPGVLYAMSLPIILEFMWDGPFWQLAAAVIGVLFLYYLAFAAGRFGNVSADGLRSTRT